jgi:hypothetical protein
MLPGMVPILGGAPKKILTFQNSGSAAPASSTHTLTDLAIGANSASRRVIIGFFGANSTRTVSGVTIGGVTARIVAQATGGNSTGCIAIAHVPTGTTATVVITWSGSQPDIGYGWWTATGLESDVEHHFGSNTAAGTGIAVNTLPGGFVVGMAGNNSSSSAYAWTNASERYDFTYDRCTSGADAVTNGSSLTVTATQSLNNTNRATIVATW